MATEQTQISANISPETKTRLEHFARSHGLKKGYLIESALLHHLQALSELPGDIIIPPQLVVSKISGERILERLSQPDQPTEAMQDLFKDESGRR